MLAASRTYTAMLLRITAKAGEPGAPAIVWEHGRRNFVCGFPGSALP